MNRSFEFSIHLVRPEDARSGDVDPTLALMGAQGWQIRGIAALASGELAVALQREFSDDLPLPDAPALSAALAAPLTAPSPEELELDEPA